VGACLVALLLLLGPQPQEVIQEIRIHGNVATSDDEIRRIAGVEIGAPVAPDTIATVTERLRASKRFERVEVLKRFASIADPSQIVLVIIVDEGAVKIERTGDSDAPVRVVKTRGPRLMFLPILTAEDGYGLIYGAQLGVPNPAGKDSRLSFPLTWGGDKRAGAELEKDFDGGLTRLSGGASINRREHPYYDEDEDRGRVWARVDRELVRSFRAGATGGWQHVSFLGADDSFTQAGVDAVVDTRRDPLLARNAVFARAAWTHFNFASGGSNNQSELEARGYVGLIAQSVLVVRVLRNDATDPLPAYLQPARVQGRDGGGRYAGRLLSGGADAAHLPAEYRETRRKRVRRYRHRIRQRPTARGSDVQEWNRGKRVGGRGLRAREHCRRARHRLLHTRPLRRESGLLDRSTSSVRPSGDPRRRGRLRCASRCRSPARARPRSAPSLSA
jgi:Surface antigen variable number repeat